MKVPPRGAVKLIGGNAFIDGLQLHTETMSGMARGDKCTYRLRQEIKRNRFWSVPFLRGPVISIYNVALMLRGKFGALTLLFATLFAVSFQINISHAQKLIADETYSITAMDNAITALTALIVVFLGINLLSKISKWHGAEHKLINWNRAYNEGSSARLEDCSIYSKHCGSVFGVYTMALYAILTAMTGIAPIGLLASLSLGYEIFYYITHNESRLSKLLFIPGLVLQMLLCSEPTEEQLLTGQCLIQVFYHSTLGKDDDSEESHEE